ncbi:hypothetical protein [Natronosalvus amylolyticus]|uniref:hypothetical protein n=1 Tax=Natronosalvus amylolyticus TaxID=2961994 RepID=UPI0020C96043|nr:hypothetical protein [Natronosalvus amylolyticus]
MRRRYQWYGSGRVTPSDTDGSVSVERASIEVSTGSQTENNPINIEFDSPLEEELKITNSVEKFVGG